jgi:hypothetical protein
MVTIMLLAIGIPTVLFTFLMLLPANDWNVKCSKSAQCVQAVRTALDTGSSDKVCLAWDAALLSIIAVFFRPAISACNPR